MNKKVAKSKAEEEYLWERFKTAGDMKAREKLAEIYYPICISIASKNAWRLRGNNFMELGDLVSYAAIGLLRGLDKCEQKRTLAEKRSYVYKTIRGRVLNSPKKWLEHFSSDNIEKIVNSLSVEPGENPVEKDYIEKEKQHNAQIEAFIESVKSDTIDFSVSFIDNLRARTERLPKAEREIIQKFIEGDRK